jgi:hypothetical protein
MQQGDGTRGEGTSSSKAGSPGSEGFGRPISATPTIGCGDLGTSVMQPKSQANAESRARPRSSGVGCVPTAIIRSELSP